MVIGGAKCSRLNLEIEKTRDNILKEFQAYEGLLQKIQATIQLKDTITKKFETFFF